MADPTPDGQPVLRVTSRLCDLPQTEGRKLRGSWMSVSPHLLPLFDEAILSNQNRNKPDEESYPTDLIEGFHLLGLLDHLLDEVFEIEDDNWYGINYGLDRVRFLVPAIAGTPLRLQALITAVKPKHRGFVVTFSCSVEMQGRSKPAFVAEFLGLWLPAERSES